MKNNEIAGQYEKKFLQLEQFAERLEALFKDHLALKSIPYQTVEVRAKSVNSFLEKINRPGKTYSDPLSEITDQVGVRVILYYPSDVLVVCDQIRSEYCVDEINSVDKKTELQDDQFGYSSVHLICKLANNRNSLLEWGVFSEIAFEVQVRTVLQHAWASISHALQYKYESDVPRQFKRRLNRLAGLLELTDAEFMSLRNESLGASAKSAEKISKDELAIPIDAISLKGYFHSSQIIKNLVKAVRKYGLNVGGGFYTVQILKVCEDLDLSLISDLDQKLKASNQYFDEFFQVFANLSSESKAVSGDEGHWAAVFLIAFYGVRNRPITLVRLGLWSEDYGERVHSSADKCQWPKLNS
jgi:putative GTP pyrophosphokinase